jgi:hypothetical protein
MKTEQYPILEYDPTPEAIIEPSKVVERMDTPEHCVITFFQEVLQKLHRESRTKIINRHNWADTERPLYELAINGKRLAAIHPGVGASLTCGILEEIIARGCRKFIVSGMGEWDPRGWYKRYEIRERLFWLSVQACMEIS